MAKKPVIVCGRGVVFAGAEAALQALAEKLNIVVATTVNGQGSLQTIMLIISGLSGQMAVFLPPVQLSTNLILLFMSVAKQDR